MGIKFAVASGLNRIVGLLGGRLERIDAPAEWQYRELQRRYQNLVGEMQGCFLKELFPELPRNESRMPLLTQLVGTNISEAMWLLRHLHQSLGVPGDVCEFGIAEGATSALIANEIRNTEKQLWLFDSFQGLSRPGAKDELIHDIFNLGSMAAYEGKMSYSIGEVQGRLRAIDFPSERVSIVPGFIEQSIRGPKLPSHVCFAYIDFDFYEPILTALNFLENVVPVGGCIVVDDYGFFSAGAQRAVDEYLEERRDDFQISLPPSWAGHFAVLTRIRTGRANEQHNDIATSLAPI